MAEPTTIRPAVSAYTAYQKDVSQKVKADLDGSGEPADFGAVQRELSSRWKHLDYSIRQSYEDMAARDKARYDEECRLRDAEVEEEQARKRAERDGVVDSRMRHRPQEEDGRRRAPPTEEELQRRKERKEARARAKAAETWEADSTIASQKQAQKEQLAKQAEARLQYLLKQSDIFKHFGVGKDMHEAQQNQKLLAKEQGKHRRGAAPGRGESDPELEEEEQKPKTATFLTRQPLCIGFGQMRHYQLEGLNWMIRLNENGINGILADEMGLGKTLQSISVLAYMHESLGVSGPHLILVPKSTMSNWINEIKRWCPALRALQFHGDKNERARLVEEEMCPGQRDSDRNWDIVVTTYETANTEKRALQKFSWVYLIIDEAHRLKNEASLFSQTVRTMTMQHRLLLTGTPLQNNLHELWALLNFLLPDVFADSEQFDEWFNLDIDDKEAKERMITQLHKILRPFMLRRLKADVEKSLPPKSETILFVGMSSVQKTVYRNVLMRDIDMVNGTGKSGRTAILNIVMQLRKCCNHPYLFNGIEDRTLPPLGEHLVENCGKMFLLSKLLMKMKDRGHRVLLFTQMTRMLDIFEDFCIMRGYGYCRIDGNTSYEAREDSIDEYNRPGSEKFLFMLSTRAGGLGINLQTADTVILYDSDWNPQADLQAMDRAHRIGQKRPVQVYRLVTENTVEEKVVERAQQKLKLDAMVVQQGRLQESTKKLNKDELLEALRFGADQVFRSKDSTITDADIDAIMERGKQRTKELEEKLQKADKGDMLDFRLDGGMALQEFEGVDYANRENRKTGGMFFIDPGKRERKRVTSYLENQAKVNQLMPVKKRPRIPKHLRLPRMDEWQFFNKVRLMELHDKEERAYAKLKHAPQENTRVNAAGEVQVLEPEEQEEKERLLAEGFGEWQRTNYHLFVKASAKYGRTQYDKIAQDVGKPAEEVERYARVFWEKGGSVFSASDWDKHIKNIEKGERKIDEINRLMDATKSFVKKFSNPWEHLTFQYCGTQGKVFNVPEDRYLLCLAHKYGYGNWELVKAAIRRSDRFRFDYYLRSCSSETLGKRCEALMKAAEKENAEWEKRNLMAPPHERERQQQQERLMEQDRRRAEESDRHQRMKEFELRLQEEARKLAEVRMVQQKLHQSHLQDDMAMEQHPPPQHSQQHHQHHRAAHHDYQDHLEFTGKDSSRDNYGRRSGDYGHAQGGGGDKKLVSYRKGLSPDDPTGWGPRPKTVPDELLTPLVNMVHRAGSKGLERLVNEFASVHQGVAKRQIERKIQDMAFKEKRDGERDCWVIKPAFQRFIDEGMELEGLHAPPGTPSRKRKMKDSPGGDGGDKPKARRERRSGGEKRPRDDGGSPRHEHTPAKSRGKMAFSLFKEENRERARAELAAEMTGDITHELVRERLREMWRELPEEEVRDYEDRVEDLPPKRASSRVDDAGSPKRKKPAVSKDPAPQRSPPSGPRPSSQGGPIGGGATSMMPF